MKKLIIFLLAFMISCGQDVKIEGKTYTPKGFISIDEKDKCIKYEVIPGNVVLGILLVETVVAPVYFFGFSIWQPVSRKQNCRKTSELVK